jgi:uncharacterized membrane protein YsdA (DUF1294 family)/cold shock CspA family protein
MGSRSTRSEGVLVSWNDERGFGFVTLDDGERIFAHISAFPPRDARPTVGERVSFAVERTNADKVQARSIRYLAVSQTMVVERRRKPGTMSYVVLATFVAAIAVVTLIGALSWWVAALYFAASLASYIAYAIDKSAAQTRQWRVSESALLGLGLLGGWPGSIVAQQRLRHKTQKTSFRQAFWGTVVLNILILGLLTTPLRERILEVARMLLSANTA